MKKTQQQRRRSEMKAWRNQRNIRKHRKSEENGENSASEMANGGENNGGVMANSISNQRRRANGSALRLRAAAYQQQHRAIFHRVA
jgi:hypothetical protein